MAAAICHSKGKIQKLKDGECECKDECKSRDIKCGPIRDCVWDPKTCTGECGRCNIGNANCNEVFVVVST